MHKLFLLILMFKYIISEQNDSNEKYIDLLPEEEKQEFLNRIARRILEGIKTNDTPNESHADITDDQLDAHDSYVQDILKQETNNFKNEAIQQNSENKEELEDRDRFESNDDNKNDQIEIAIHEGIRKKRKNNEQDDAMEPTTEFSYDVIPVQTIYDQSEKKDDVRNNTEILHSSNNNMDLESVDSKNIEGITETPTSDLKDLYLKENITLHDNQTEKVESLRKSYGKYQSGTTLITDFEPNSNENSPRTEDYNTNSANFTSTPISKEMNKSTTSDEITWGSTQKIYVEDSSNENEVANINVTTSVYENSTVDEIQTVTSSSIDVIEVSNSETIVDSTTENTTVSKSTQDVNYKFNKNYLRSKNDTNDLLLKNLERDQNFTHVSTETISVDKSSSNPLGVAIIDNSHDELITTQNIMITEGISINNLSMTTSELPAVTYVETSSNRNIVPPNLLNNTHVLRTGRDNLLQSEIDDNKFLQNDDAEHNKLKVYEVYEVDPNKPHFITMDKPKVKDHPYYIPVYNYAPDNAYFKSYNKFGPNAEDTQNNSSKSGVVVDDTNHLLIIDIPTLRKRFAGYNNQEVKHDDVRNTKSSNKKRNLNLHEVIKPNNHKLVTQNVFFNRHDYQDMDYYLGPVSRTGKNNNYVNERDQNYELFPNSNELDHPVSSIHKSNNVKDHVRAIRKLLYLQKLFGYVPKETDITVRKANQYLQSGKNSKNQKKDDIAMDYYFNRADSKEQDVDGGLFRISKSITKNINPNIVPLTPNPLELGLFLKRKQTKKQIYLKKYVRNKRIIPERMTFHELFQSMLVVLEDTIKLNDDNLIKYDWLKTTVNIQAAITKLIDLIVKLRYGQYVHPKDIELIKYTLYLFKSSDENGKDGLKNQNLNGLTDSQQAKKNKKLILPKTKRRIREPLKMWIDYAAYILRDEFESKGEKYKLLYDFEKFLYSLLFYLNDLHDAVKHIASITEYNSQAWFPDLKAIFLKEGDKKKLAQVILHLSLSRLLDLVEDSAKSGLEDSFRIFVMNNKEVVKRSREESIFVLNVLTEIRKMHMDADRE